jgi:membrane dipeptidase
LNPRKKQRKSLFLFLLLLSSLTLFEGCEDKEPPKKTDEEILNTARAIHERVLTLDAHVDIEVSFFTPKFYMGKNHEKLVTLSGIKKGGMDAVFFSVYTEQGPRTDEYYARVWAQALDKFNTIYHVLTEDVTETVALALHPDDVLRAHAEGKLAAMIGVENGYPIGEDLRNIKKLYDRGCRYITLSHNGHNQICDSGMSRGESESEHNGLSDFGKEVIAEMNRLGIIVDISHVSKKAMLDAAAFSKAPVIASHSCCRALCDVSRNLDNEQLLALKQNGGVIHIVGLNAFVKEDPPEKIEAISDLREEFGFPTEFLAFFHAFEKAEVERRNAYEQNLQKINSRFPSANLKDYADHIDYAVKLIGIDHVGISSDFYESGYCIKGWENMGETFNITLELVRRGYTEEEILKLWSGNLLRVWREVEKISFGYL